MQFGASEATDVNFVFAVRWLSLAVGSLVVAIAIVSAGATSVGSAGYIRIFIDLPQTIVVCAVVLLMGAIAARGIVQSVTCRIRPLFALRSLIRVPERSRNLNPFCVARGYRRFARRGILAPLRINARKQAPP